jgi:hypothetical protein
VSEETQDLENSLNRLRDRYAEMCSKNEALRKAGASLSKEVMVVMLNGGSHEELIKAHDDWKDLTDGKPKWGKTCTK